MPRIHSIFSNTVLSLLELLSNSSVEIWKRLEFELKLQKNHASSLFVSDPEYMEFTAPTTGLGIEGLCDLKRLLLRGSAFRVQACTNFWGVRYSSAVLGRRVYPLCGIRASINTQRTDTQCIRVENPVGNPGPVTFGMGGSVFWDEIQVAALFGTIIVFWWTPDDLTFQTACYVV